MTTGGDGTLERMAAATQKSIAERSTPPTRAAQRVPGFHLTSGKDVQGLAVSLGKLELGNPRLFLGVILQSDQEDILQQETSRGG